MQPIQAECQPCLYHPHKVILDRTILDQAILDRAILNCVADAEAECSARDGHATSWTKLQPATAAAAAACSKPPASASAAYDDVQCQ